MTDSVALPPEKWSFSGNDPFTGVADARGLLQVRHPWVASRAGNFGEWRAEIEVPIGWRGQPLYLSFYQSDNYCGLNEHPNPSFGIQAFVGHRFKQLWVNDELAWEQDVADDELVGPAENYYYLPEKGAAFQEPYRVIQMPVFPTPRAAIAFRAYDKVSSTTRLPGDCYRRYGLAKSDPAQAAAQFQTDVFFGDVFLTRSAHIVRPPARPVVVNPAPRSSEDEFPAEGVGLQLQTVSPLPPIGFPVRCGVPMTQGLIGRNAALSILGPHGDPVEAVIEPISWWPDDSVRWLLCNFIARDTGKFRLVRRVAPQRAALNDAVELQLGGPSGHGLFESLTVGGKRHLGKADLSVKMNCTGWTEHFTARRASVETEDDNAVGRIIRLSGDLISKTGKRFGPWSARVFLYKDWPVLIMDWQLVNESDQYVAMLLDSSVRFELPHLTNAVADFGPFDAPQTAGELQFGREFGATVAVADRRAVPLYADTTLLCFQEKAGDARLYQTNNWIGSATRAPGFVNVTHGHGGFVAAMKWFHEEFPKGIFVRPDELVLAMAPESEGVISWRFDAPWTRMGRGEAKRQTIALWFRDGRINSEEAERFNACLQDPPRLFDRDWFLRSEVIETGPANITAQVQQWEKIAGPAIARTGINFPRLGHREYWDTAWMNGYRSRAHIGLIRYFETGDPKWCRYFDAACCHHRDVDVIHFCPEHADWVGRRHQEGVDHTSAGPASSMGTNADDLLEHYLMNGDLDSLAVVRRIAERILEFPVYARSAREIGWPLAQLARCHDQFRDARFLARARECFDAARLFSEPRRGVFVQCHGGVSYRGAVGFMNGFLAYGLIRYHRATNDPAALALLRDLSAGLVAETQIAPGSFRYSPNPENNVGATGSGASPLFGGLFGYLYLQTGDRRYRQLDRECFDYLLANPDMIRMDRLHLAGWMIKGIAGDK
ncbi:MAG: hypothetical protein HY360_10415 [Verrucomicrobia bacterium]|nr:hypothetical protein [Verrucomicrobiota bacterium]